jgi:hypothetical protein
MYLLFKIIKGICIKDKIKIFGKIDFNTHSMIATGGTTKNASKELILKSIKL